MMSTEMEVDLASITDEDILRRLWQQAEDFGRKKEIRSYIYKLRETKLRNFYNFESMDTTDFAGFKTSSHGDSLADQSFQSFKTKEIRDSSSPPHELRYHHDERGVLVPNTSGWNIVGTSEVSPDGRSHKTDTLATTQGVKKIVGGQTEFAGRNEQMTQGSHYGDDKNYVKSAAESSKTHLQEQSVVGDEKSGNFEKRSSKVQSSSHVSSSEQRMTSGGSPGPFITKNKTAFGDGFDRSNVSQQQENKEEQHFRSNIEKREQSHQNVVREEQRQQQIRQESHSERQHISSSSTNNQEHLQDSTASNQAVNRETLVSRKLTEREIEVMDAIPGKILSRNIEYPDANTKVIIETKELPDGRIVRTRKYHTTSQGTGQQILRDTTKKTSSREEQRRESTSSHVSKQSNSSIKQQEVDNRRQTSTQQQRDTVDKSVTNLKNQVETFPVDDSHRAVKKDLNQTVRNEKISSEDFIQTERGCVMVDHTNQRSSEKYTQEKQTSRRESETPDFTTRGFPSVREPEKHPKAGRDHKPDFSTNGFPSVRQPNKPQEKTPDYTTQGFPSTKPQEPKVGKHHSPEPDFSTHGFPSVRSDSKVTKQQSTTSTTEQRSNYREKVEASSKTQYEVKEHEVRGFSEKPESLNTKPDYTTRGFPSTKEPEQRPHQKADFSTHGFPSAKGPEEPNRQSPRYDSVSNKEISSKTEQIRGHVKETIEGGSKTEYHTNEKSVLMTDKTKEPHFTTHGFPSVKSPDDTISRRPSTQEYSSITKTEILRGKQPDFTTHGFPSVSDTRTDIRRTSQQTDQQRTQTTDVTSRTEYENREKQTSGITRTTKPLEPDYGTHGFPSVRSPGNQDLADRHPISPSDKYRSDVVKNQNQHQTERYILSQREKVEGSSKSQYETHERDVVKKPVFDKPGSPSVPQEYSPSRHDTPSEVIKTRVETDTYRRLSKDREDSPAFTTHGFPSVRDDKRTTSQTTIETNYPHGKPRDRDVQDLTTHGFPSVKSPASSTKTFSVDVQRPKQQHVDADDHSSITTETFNVSETYHPVPTVDRISVEVNASHEAFARSLRCISPVDQHRGSSRSVRTSTSSVRTPTSADRKNRRSPSRETDTSKVSTSTITKGKITADTGRRTTTGRNAVTGTEKKTTTTTSRGIKSYEPANLNKSTTVDKRRTVTGTTTGTTKMTTPEGKRESITQKDRTTSKPQGVHGPIPTDKGNTEGCTKPQRHIYPSGYPQGEVRTPEVSRSPYSSLERPKRPSKSTEITGSVQSLKERTQITRNTLNDDIDKQRTTTKFTKTQKVDNFLEKNEKSLKQKKPKGKKPTSDDEGYEIEGSPRSESPTCSANEIEYRHETRNEINKVDSKKRTRNEQRKETDEFISNERVQEKIVSKKDKILKDKETLSVNEGRFKTTGPDGDQPKRPEDVKKPKKPFNRTETYEERCRKILGMDETEVIEQTTINDFISKEKITQEIDEETKKRKTTRISQENLQIENDKDSVSSRSPVRRSKAPSREIIPKEEHEDLERISAIIKHTNSTYSSTVSPQSSPRKSTPHDTPLDSPRTHSPDSSPTRRYEDHTTNTKVYKNEDYETVLSSTGKQPVDNKSPKRGTPMDSPTSTLTRKTSSKVKSTTEEQDEETITATTTVTTKKTGINEDNVTRTKKVTKEFGSHEATDSAKTRSPISSLERKPKSSRSPQTYSPQSTLERKPKSSPTYDSDKPRPSAPPRSTESSPDRKNIHTATTEETHIENTLTGNKIRSYADVLQGRSPTTSPVRKVDDNVPTSSRSPTASPTRQTKKSIPDTDDYIVETTKTEKVSHITTANICLSPSTKKPSGVEKDTLEPSKKPSSHSPVKTPVEKNKTEIRREKVTEKKTSKSNVYEETTDEEMIQSTTQTSSTTHSKNTPTTNKKHPVTERKESAPVYGTKTTSDVSQKMSRSTSENVFKTTNITTGDGKSPTKPQIKTSTESATKTTPRKGSVDKGTSRTEKRPNKHLSTKTINLTATNTIINSEDMENVVIDIQQAKSSREPSPNKMIPIPVPIDQDTGKPRFPDVVHEPEEDRRKPKIKNIPIFEEESSDYVRCHITEVEDVHEEKLRKKISKTELLEDEETLVTTKRKTTSRESSPLKDKFIPTLEEDDECLLTVHDKVNKFINSAEEIKKPKSSAPFKREKVGGHYPEDDVCLLSVNDKVSKFSTTPERSFAHSIDKSTSEKYETIEKISKTKVDETVMKKKQESKLAEQVDRFVDSTERVIGPVAPQRSPELVAQIERQKTRSTDQSTTSRASTQVTSYRSVKGKDTESLISPSKPILKSSEVIKKAKSVFEKNEIKPGTSTPNTKQKDILSRPSVWEGKKSTKAQDVKLQDIGVYRKYTDETIETDDYYDRSRSRSPDSVDYTKRKPFKTSSILNDSVSSKKDIFESKISSLTEEDRYGSTTKRDTDIGRRPSPSDYSSDNLNKRDVEEYSTRKSSSKYTSEYSTDVSEDYYSTMKSATSQSRSNRQRTEESPIRSKDKTVTSESPKTPAYQNISGRDSTTHQHQHTSGKSRLSSDSATIKKNLFETTRADSPSASEPRRPSYMDHTISSLEHRRESSEVGRSYLRKSSADSSIGHDMSPARDGNPRSGTKFGVELKRTDSKSGDQPRRKSSCPEIPHIEGIFDLELLERMLHTVVGYEQRRRIRSQIRVVKKIIETENRETTLSTHEMTKREYSSSRGSSPSPDRKHMSPSLSPDRNRFSPSRRENVRTSSSNQFIKNESRHVSSHEERIVKERSVSPVISKKTTTTVTEVRKSSGEKPVIMTTTTITTTGAGGKKKVVTQQKKEIKDEKPIWATKNILRKASENDRSTKMTGSSSVRKITSSSTSSSSSKMQSQSTQSRRIETDEDCITSSYGIGPTDEDGRPLFGIRALKKKSTQPSETTKVTGTVITEKYYSENGAPPVGERKVTMYSTNPADVKKIESKLTKGKGVETVKRESTSKGGMTTVTRVDKLSKRSSGDTDTEEEIDEDTLPAITDGKTMICECVDSNQSPSSSTLSSSKVNHLVRKGSVKEMTEKFARKSVDNSVGPRITEKSSSVQTSSQQSYPKAGLILRTQSHSSFTESGEETSPNGSVLRNSSRNVVESQQMSFLNSSGSKVTGVSDILNRMRNADNVQEEGDTIEDQEARALLNKFLGASVLMSGMQSMCPGEVTRTTERENYSKESNRHELSPSANTERNSSSIEEKRRDSSSLVTQETCAIEEISNEEYLKNLLQKSNNYEDRRRIRTRLRQLMAERADLSSFEMNKSDEGSVIDRNAMAKFGGQRPAGPVPKPMSPFAKFRQLDKQNSLQSPSSPLTPTSPGGTRGSAPFFKFTDASLNARAATAKEQLLQWCQMKTKEYENVDIKNFSTSWTDGLAFCALIHHFLPDAFDYSKLTPQQRRHNFELAFRVADEKAGIAPLLDVEDMVVMRKPDWKCVFTYVQSIYRRFRDCQ